MRLPSIPSELPLYLGLGMLDIDSIQSTPKGQTASYRQDGDLVYTVHLSPGQAEVQEFYKGQEISRTVRENLLVAFTRHFAAQDIYQSLRFRDLFDPLLRQGKIINTLSNKLRYVFHPAGMILGLRLPLDIDRSADWLQVKPGFEDPGSPLEIVLEKEGFLFYLLQDGSVRSERILVLEFSALLMDVRAAIQAIIRSGLVGEDQEHYLVMTEMPCLENEGIIVYPGDFGKGHLTHTFLPVSAPKTLDEVTGQFHDLSVKFIKSKEK